VDVGDTRGAERAPEDGLGLHAERVAVEHDGRRPQRARHAYHGVGAHRVGRPVRGTDGEDDREEGHCEGERECDSCSCTAFRD